MSVNMSREKVCLRDSDQVRHIPGCTATDLQCRIKEEEGLCYIYVAKTKTLSSSAVIAQLTCAFVVVYIIYMQKQVLLLTRLIVRASSKENMFWDFSHLQNKLELNLNVF